MSSIRRLVFWQNLNSHLQSPYLQALHEAGEYDVRWMVERDIASSERAGMGWSSSVGSLPVCVAPTDTEIAQFVGEHRAETLHVFTGIHGEPMVRRAHQAAVRQGARIALLNEPPIPNALYRAEHGANALKAALRPLIHKSHQIVHGHRVEAIWAIGHMAVDWYRRLGYPEARIFPWAYFPPGPDGEGLRLVSDDRDLRLLYVGQVNARKGLDVLIRALCDLKDQPWHLRVIGRGPLLPLCQNIAEHGGIAEQIEWLDFLPHTEAMSAVETSDLVIVPSRHDGWGAVVNESLSRGACVICTDRCGSADLLKNSACGKIVRSDDAAALREAVQGFLGRVEELRRSKSDVRTWAERISPISGAAYFGETVKYLNGGGAKPEAPWFTKERCAPTGLR